MVDRFEHNGWIVASLGQHEGALKDRLCVPGQARCADTPGGGSARKGGGEVGFQGFGMAEDVRSTGLAHGRAGVERLLGHGANQACVVSRGAGNEGCPEVQVGEDTVGRILVVVIGGSREERSGGRYRVENSPNCRLGTS